MNVDMSKLPMKSAITVVVSVPVTAVLPPVAVVTLGCLLWIGYWATHGGPRAAWQMRRVRAELVGADQEVIAAAERACRSWDTLMRDSRLLVKSSRREPIRSVDAARRAAVGRAEQRDVLVAPTIAGVREHPRGVEIACTIPAGLCLADFERRAEVFAPAWAVERVIVLPGEKPREATLIASVRDPLAGVRLADARLEQSSVPAVRVGRHEDGSDVVVDLQEATHVAIQGMTRSGKSCFSYSLLSGLAHATAVEVVGCDPTAILLGPWVGRPGGRFRATGGGDMAAHATALDNLVAEMDIRITQLVESRRDKLEAFTSEMPLLVTVLEEYPGLLAAAESEDRAAGRSMKERVAPRIVANVRRLVQEGAKVGVRVVIIAQRFDAAIVGGAERSNLGYRMSFRVDRQGQHMLHPDLDSQVGEQVREFAPGVGVLDAPGTPTAVFKSDLTEYEAYVRRVAGASDGRRAA